MRYRRLSYRYALVLSGTQSLPWGDVQPTDQSAMRFAQTFWRPAADICESDRTIELTVDLAGVDPDEIDVALFEDALIVEGRRRLGTLAPGGVYHRAEIRQGPFRLELPLPCSIDQERVEAQYDQGLLRITFDKVAPKAR